MTDASSRLPYSYRAFGLAVESDMELDGFVPSGSTGIPDVRVRVGTPALEYDGGVHIRAKAEGVLEASIGEGREVIVDANPEADPLYVSAIVTGELFSVVLRQRGLLVLHGSGVAKDGRAIGFIGNSGWGKSTLAASLVERGWRLLTDDLLVVDGLLDASDTPTVVPTHPSMRLSEEAIDRVDVADSAQGQAHALTSKVRVDQTGAFSDQPTPLHQVFVLDPRLSDAHQATPLSARQAVDEADSAQGQAHALTSKVRVDQTGAFSDQPTPLHQVFVLDPRPSDAHQATPLSAREAVDEMVRHTRGRRLVVSPSAMATHLAQCASLARRVPVAALRRQYGLDHLDALCDLVEDGVQSPVT